MRKNTRFELMKLTYLNGVTIATYRSTAIPQRFAMEMIANCHAKIPRSSLSQKKVVSQKYATGKKKMAKEKSAAARDRTNQFVDVCSCFVAIRRKITNPFPMIAVEVRIHPIAM